MNAAQAVSLFNEVCESLSVRAETYLSLVHPQINIRVWSVEGVDEEVVEVRVFEDDDDDLVTYIIPVKYFWMSDWREELMSELHEEALSEYERVKEFKAWLSGQVAFPLNAAAA